MRLFGQTSVYHTEATRTIATAGQRGQKPQSTVRGKKMGIATHPVQQGGKTMKLTFITKNGAWSPLFSNYGELPYNIG